MSTDGGSILSRLVPSFVRSRYRVKFVVAIASVIILIGVTGVVGSAMIKDTVEDDTRGQLQETSELQAEALGEWIERMRVQTRSLSSEQPLRRIEGDESQYLAGRQARLSNDSIGIHLVNTSTGTVTASTAQIEGFQLETLGVPWADVNVSGETSQTADRVWVSDSAYESPLQPYDEKYVTAFASAVPNQEDRYVVVVTRIQPHLRTTKDENTRSVTKIVNEDGGRVLYPADQVRSTIRGETLDQVRERGSSDFRRANGVAYAYSKVDGTNWVAVTALDADHAFAVSNAVEKQVLAIVVIALVSLSIVGTVLARQTVKPLADLRHRVAAMKEGNLDVDFESNRTDEIGALYAGFDDLQRALKEQLEQVRSARQAAEAERKRVATINEHLEEKATEYGAVMEACSAGDLTRRMDPESENEAMTEIADAFNDMMNRIDRTVAHLRGFAEEVAASSEEVTASSEEVRSASQQVTGSVQEISDGAERQEQHFQTVSDEVDDLSNAIQKIAGATDQVAELAAETADTGQEGRESAEKAIEGMASVQSRAETAVDAIETLQAEMEHIDELSEFIAEIANQTNMLALNANIEASRSNSAGDGHGFAVVASEVKDLAEEAREAAEEIDDRLERIQGQTVETADEVRATSRQIADHAETVEEAAIALDEIAGYANQTNQGVQQISSATQQQSASAQQIVAMVDRAASISAETTNEAENVAAAAEEQTTSLTEVTRSAGHLSKKSNRLQEALARIETSQEAIDSGDVLEVLTAPDEETVGDAKSIDDLMGPSGGAEDRSSVESEMESDVPIDAKRS